MGENTGISWTDHTFNPFIGCQKVSPACEKCYAEAFVTGRMRLPVWGPAKTTERKRTTTPWKELPRWNRAAARDGVRRKVFCASLADIFEDHPQVGPWRDEALALLASCTSLDVQLLTKRPENIRRMVPAAWLAPGGWPKHIWVGTTVEDQRRGQERVRHLLAVPAAVRFLSCEPLLEEVDLSRWLGRCGVCGKPEVEHPYSKAAGWRPPLMCCSFGEPSDRARGVRWVIVGGESGPGARPFDIAWARKIVAQCREAEVPAFVKQMGDNPVLDGVRVDYGRHGADPSVWSNDLRVQQFPEVE